MEVTGKIIVALPEVSGTSKAGNQWKKREYVLETLDNYPSKIMFDFFGERADQYPLSVGDEIKLSFDIESREYNGRWYTSIRGWKAEKTQGAATAAAAPASDPFAAASAAPAFNPSPADSNDDLPF
ncbi:MAG: DUF3127 domain-containing protein [Muribaculaceae bacterium]|nr:DUF3127 domain-containing protein [Muribaculaceae bacterium]